jgi:FkbH-like protein
MATLPTSPSGNRTGCPSPTDALQALRQQGRLATDFGNVGRLLARLPRPDRGRVGQWLAQVGAAEIATKNPGVASARIAVTGTSTVAGLVPHLVAAGAVHGLLIETHVRDSHDHRADVLNAAGASREGPPNVTLCLLDPYLVFDQVGVPWQVDDVTRALDATLGELADLARAFSRSGGSELLVLNTLPLSVAFASQLVDYRSRSALGAAWRRFNAAMLELCLQHERVVTVDLDAVTSRVATDSDLRLATYARQYYSEDALAGYATEAVALARHVLGRTKKMLVLDLDNTLWGGVLAEDGPEGIVLGGGDEGGAYRAFQRVVRQLAAQGVLLAVCSKNEQNEVRATLADHPGMVLREEDFAVIRANWRPKSDNVTDIAAVANLAPDSFVFVDDSAFECELVQAEHAGLAVVQVDGDPALQPLALLSEGFFTVRELTLEDRGRGQLYRIEAERQDFLSAIPSMQDYLAALDLHVTLRSAREADVTRVSQLTLRTNQFNLTTRRLEPAQVRELTQRDAKGVLIIEADDRFGGCGIVGAVFTSTVDNSLLLDNLLLSCRVFSRSIETACVVALLEQARATGLRSVVGFHRPSAKNHRVAGFYPQHGFRPADQDERGTRFVHDLGELPDRPPHITLAATFSSEE